MATDQVMGWQVGFRYDGVYHSYVVLKADQGEALKAAMGQTLIPWSKVALLSSLTFVDATGQVYKA
jgi:hypothetical protein